MCEATRQLAKAAYELEQMWTRGVWDYPKLKQLLNQQCEHEDT